MDDLRQDLRYAFRVLAKRPLFTLVAALSLAIGIGATTALFSVVNVLVLRPLPGVDGYERAVELGRGNRGHGFDTFSWPEILDIRSQAGALDRVAAYRMASFSYDTGDGGVPITAMLVSSGYFDALGVRPARGRFLAPDADQGLGGHPEVVVSQGFWQNHLGGGEVLGRTIRLNRQAFTVVGVTPEAFGGHMIGIRNEVWVPLTMAPAMHEVPEAIFDQRSASWVQAVGRLAPGATLDQADAQVAALFERLQTAHPDTNRDRTARVIPLGPIPGGGRTAVVGFLGALMTLVTLVLMVTCANVAGMFLARAAAREKEIAVRLAVGSGRARLVRQLLTESLVVFVAGGAGGALLAWWGTGLVDFGSLPIPVDLSLDLRPDGTVLAFALAVTLGVGLVFGLVPALQAVRPDLLTILRDEGGAGRRRSRLRSAFVTSQVGLSLVLLAAAGLFLRSLQGASRVHTGFDARGVYSTSLDLDREGYGPEEGRSFLVSLRERLAGLPGVESSAVALDLPMDLSSHGTAAWPEGWVGPDGEPSLGVDFNIVSPGYFRTLGIEQVRGRLLEDADRLGSEEVAVVSRAFAEQVWPGGDAVGRRIRFNASDGPLITVVGVVDDVKNQTIMDARKPFVYRPYQQSYDARVDVLVRSRRDPADLAASVRAAILDVDPSVSLTPVVSVDRLTSVGILPQRIAASVATGLGALALLLSGLGIYGVVAYTVSRRTREIGVRMALGAGAGRVRRDVVVGALKLVLPGMAVGGGLALLLGRFLESNGFLLGTRGTDPVALGSVAAGLVGVVLLASFVPARRASTVHPVEALRYE